MEGEIGHPIDLGPIELRTCGNGVELRRKKCGDLNDVPSRRKSWRCSADHSDQRCDAVHFGSELDPLY